MLQEKINSQRYFSVALIANTTPATPSLCTRRLQNMKEVPGIGHTTDLRKRIARKSATLKKKNTYHNQIGMIYKFLHSSGRFIAVIFICRALLGFGFSHAQTTKISGRVTDAKTKEALPFVNIRFKGSKVGTTSNPEGYFEIETYYATDSIQASFVGYRTSVKKVRKDHAQRIDFEMHATDHQFREVVVKYEKAENPAHAIIRKAIRNKEINNKEKLTSYEYETYNKIEFDLNNLTDKFKNRKVFKPFRFVFDGIDSTSENKEYLPVFLTESLSDFYFRKKPKTQKEIIKATKVSGTKNKSVQQFLGDMYMNVNVYHNYMQVFSKNFVSPIAGFGFAYYRYYLVDSAFIGNDWCYKIQFVPRRKQEPCFKGDIWINDTSYAVREIEGTIARDANINFVNELYFKQEFNEVEKEVWMPAREHVVVDFNLTRKTMGLYGRKTTSYKNFVINQVREDAFYNGPVNTIVADDADEKDANYWQTARHDTLRKNEQFIYNMSDSIAEIPAFRTYVDIVSMLLTGYKVTGPIEIGPYSTLYSNNPVEGTRLRLGGRTSNAFSSRLMLEGYGAYGFKDQRFKYNAGFLYFLSKKPRHHIAAYYKDDVEQLGQSENAYATDNVVSAFFQRNPFLKLTRLEECKAYYDREWFPGFSNQLMFRRQRLHPLGELEYVRIKAETNALEKVEHITRSELIFYTRWAHNEKFLSGEFERISLGTKYPILSARYALGIKGVWNSQYHYNKLQFNLHDWFNTGPLGWTSYAIEAGKIWGILPYPLLNLHSGNETYYYYEHAFNTMNYFEFISDEWVSARVEHHFDGLFFNRVPLLRKLKWREVATFKGVTGRLKKQHQKELLPGKNMHALYNGPFLEGAVGIENILTFIRFDFLYRITYLDHPNIVRFGIRGKFQIDF